MSVSLNILLISTYELSRQPFGLASPAAWLRREGHRVTCIDCALEPLPTDGVRKADLIAFYIPMHTATRLALQLLDRVKDIESYSTRLFLRPLCSHERTVSTTAGGRHDFRRRV